MDDSSFGLSKIRLNKAVSQVISRCASVMNKSVLIVSLHQESCHGALKIQALELNGKSTKHREVDSLKAAEKEETVAKSHECWAGDS